MGKNNLNDYIIYTYKLMKTMSISNYFKTSRIAHWVHLFSMDFDGSQQFLLCFGLTVHFLI